MNKPRCGRCRGRGTIRPIGLGPDVICDECGGTGNKPAYKPKAKVQISYGGRPEVCIFEGRIPGRECFGSKDWHHVVPKQRIIDKITGGRGVTVELAKTLRDALSDHRNLVGACNGCHLGVVETANPAARVEQDDLPRGFWDFVNHYDLEGAVPRHLALSEAA